MKQNRITVGLWIGIGALSLGMGHAPPSVPSPLPSFKKVFIVVLENTNYGKAKEQPFLSQLVSEGAILKNFWAEGRPSQANYIAMVAGELHGVNTNGNVEIPFYKTIADLLEENGRTWKSYAEDYPGNCFLGASSGKYVRKHTPFLSFPRITSDPERCARIVNASALMKDIENGTLPDYSLFIPNLDSDGHDTGVEHADQWLSSTFGPLLQDPRFMKDMLFVVTFDESGIFGFNHVYTTLYGDSVLPGSSTSTSHDHYSILKLLEDTWNLGNLNQRDTLANPIEGIWR